MTEQTTQIIKYAQSFETKVHIVNKLNAKLEATPEVEITISRKLEDKEDIFNIVSKDVEEVIKKVKEALERLK